MTNQLSDPSMKILVTGGAGFLGSRLIRALLSGAGILPNISRIIAADLSRCPVDDPRVESRTGTITDPAFISSIVDPDLDLVYHLAAVLSGQSEDEFDLGLQVNVDASRHLLEACRRLRKPPRFVFSSSIAVFGGSLPEVVPEETAATPQSSYGTGKAIAELLVSDYSRRGFVDGIALRLPTIAIRPGKPNSALSSFVSGIIREPLAGIDAVCPVPLELPLWISSPGTVTANLLHAGSIPASALEGRRMVNLPGLSVTPADMLASLERLAGAPTRARVRAEPDQRVMRVACTWPGAFDVTRALRLGFHVDTDIDAIVRQFMAETPPLASQSRP
jgi:nucleoside-diphosphate-sugar epimerase